MGWSSGEITAIVWGIYPNQSNTATNLGNLDCLCNDEVSDILALGIDTLKPYAVASPVYAVGLQFEDLSYRIMVSEVDWNGTDGFGFGKPFRDAVDAVYPGGTTEDRRVGTQ